MTISFIFNADPELRVNDPVSTVFPISVSDPDTFRDPVIITSWTSGLTYDAVWEYEALIAFCDQLDVILYVPIGKKEAVSAFKAQEAVPNSKLLDGIVIPVVSIIADKLLLTAPFA